MEDQVPDNCGIARVAGEGPQVFAMPRPVGRPLRRPRPQIQSGNGQVLPGEPQTQFTRAGADFEHVFPRVEQGRQSSRNPAVATEREVREPKIAAIVQRIRMIRWQRIEQLRFEGALHGRGVGGKMRFNDINAEETADER